MGSFRLVAGNRHLHRYYNFAGRAVETVPRRAGVSPYTSPFGFAETCVFVKQSPGPFHCDSYLYEHPFSRSYGVIMPSSLTTLLPLALGFSPHLPVSVCGTGAFSIPPYFSRHNLPMLRDVTHSLSPRFSIPGVMSRSCVIRLKLLAATESLPCVHRLRLSASP